MTCCDCINVQKAPLWTEKIFFLSFKFKSNALKNQQNIMNDQQINRLFSTYVGLFYQHQEPLL